jgi:hypothetical protein
MTAFFAAVSLMLAPANALAFQEPQPQAERHEAKPHEGLPPLVTLLLVSIGIIGVLYVLGTVIDGGEGDPASP